MRPILAVLVSAVLLLGGCGEDTSSGEATDEPTDASSEATSAEPSPTKDPTADWPACHTVWKKGAVLPNKYRGCRAGDQAVKADAEPCMPLGRKLVTFGQHFWAGPDVRRGAKLIIRRTPGPVKQDPGYRNAQKSCSA